MHVFAQRHLHVAEFLAQARELAPELAERAILRGNRRVERLHGLVEERDAHFQFRQALFKRAVHRRPSAAAAGSTYFTS